MKGDLLPDKDHVSRYCPNTQIYEDGDIDSAVFSLRKMKDGPEKYLSVHWIEFFSGEIEEALVEIRPYLKRIRDYTPESVCAVLNVGHCKEHVKEYSDDNRALGIKSEESRNNPAHAGIYNLSMDDDIVLELITEIVIRKYPNN